MRFRSKVLCLVLLASCSKPPASGEGPVTEATVLPTQQSIQSDFVNRRCVSCHEAATAANRHVALSDLSNVIEGSGHAQGHARKLIKPGCPKESFFLSILKEGKMPPSPSKRVSMEILQAIEKWIIGLKPDAGKTCDDEPPDPPGDDGEPGGD